MLCEKIGCHIKRIELDTDYDLDEQDFCQKYDATVKIVAISSVSNVTGTMHSLDRIRKHLRPETIFIVDASQSIPHLPLDVQEKYKKDR